MYVNEYTEDCGDDGMKAIRLLLDMAYENGMLDREGGSGVFLSLKGEKSAEFDVNGNGCGKMRRDVKDGYANMSSDVRTLSEIRLVLHSFMAC
jgi:hypothetical protein